MVVMKDMMMMMMIMMNRPCVRGVVDCRVSVGGDGDRTSKVSSDRMSKEGTGFQRVTGCQRR